MIIEDKVKITDDHGFYYDVTIKHWPNTGISIAYFNGDRIASRSYGKISPPNNDSDREWEIWEERFREWADASICDLILDCRKHFNDEYKLRRLV